jgi:hypothetical protein
VDELRLTVVVVQDGEGEPLLGSGRRGGREGRDDATTPVTRAVERERLCMRAPFLRARAAM